MDNNAWKQCVDFHGHACPGLAIGFRAGEAALQYLGVTFSSDEEIVCVTENDACGVDAIQVLTGCSLGKGNLIYRGRGKQAFSFFDRKTGKKIRVILKVTFPRENMDREAVQEAILHTPIDELFDFKIPSFEVPEEARLFSSLPCDLCGESAAEHMMRLMNGKTVCLDCTREYTRGW
ncbi:MAG: TraR/DksA C4-type zinc finger protein [Deltaproteobacteria bacterium]|nr:TraR/DksA C4-type zinc finger protein [Deltaproteobacteria bacterium]